MRQWLFGGFLCASTVLSATACTLAPEVDSAATISSQVLPADARALVYGRTVSEMLQSSELRDKIPALFGADWMPGRGQIASGASAFFEKGGPLRMVRIAGNDYVAVTGCVASACPTRRVLTLIAEGGSSLLARLDDGAVPHYYAFGSGGVAPPGNAAAIADAGLRALQRVDGAYP